jgi:hypothetical protein
MHASPKQRNRCFLALFGEDAEPHLSLLNVEHGVGAVSLRKDGFFWAITPNSPSSPNIG